MSFFLFMEGGGHLKNVENWLGNPMQVSLLINIKNAPNDLIFLLNLSMVDEKANILFTGRQVKMFADS